MATLCTIFRFSSLTSAIQTKHQSNTNAIEAIVKRCFIFNVENSY